MHELARASGIGAVSGARTLLGPALVAHTVRLNDIGWLGRLITPATNFTVRRLLMLIAAAELVADKSARIPARTALMPLVGRVTTGALSAAAAGPPGRQLRAAATGAASALCATYGLYYLRRYATDRLRTPKLVAGLVEDGLAVAAGLLLLRAKPPS